MVPFVAWSIHTLLLLPFYAEKRRVGGLSTWPPVRAGGGSYQPEFRMCRVVVHRVENSCLRTFKPAWKQGSQTELKWGQTGTPCRFWMRGTVSVSPSGCWRVQLWEISNVCATVSYLCSTSIRLECTNKVIVHDEHDAQL